MSSKKQAPAALKLIVGQQQKVAASKALQIRPTTQPLALPLQPMNFKKTG